MISISDKNGSLLRGVKRCEDTGRLVPYKTRKFDHYFQRLRCSIAIQEGIEEASARWEC